MYDVLKGIEGSKRPNNYTPGFGIVSCKLVVAGWDGFGDTLVAKCFALDMQILLGGSWDLVSMVIRTLIGVISRYKYSYLDYNPSY